MSTIVLVNPIERRFERVDANIGDLVKIAEWDHIEVEGIVTELSDKKISVSHATFLGGCYQEMDYSAHENQTVFSFDLENVACIKVATFENVTPLTLISEAMGKNFCGSEKIIMSPMMFEKYRRYVRDSKMQYLGISIEVDESLQGLYVYAVPNAESIKHLETPMEIYDIEYLVKGQKGKYERVCTDIVSAFTNELKEAVSESVNKIHVRFLQYTNVEKMLYRVKLNNNVVKRGIV